MENNRSKKQIKPNIIVSRCLLGEPCRFDQTDKYSDDVYKLRKYVNFIDICPEMDIGLGTPRETLRSVIDASQRIKLVSNVNHIDITNRMNDFLDSFFKHQSNIDGAILKSKSPSCGYNNTALFDENNKRLPQKSSGFFTLRLIKEFPHARITDEQGLKDHPTSVHFYAEIFDDRTSLYFKE